MTFYGENVATSWCYVHGDVISLNSFKQVQNGGTVTMYEGCSKRSGPGMISL